MTPAADEELLKGFYRNLTLGPLAPGDPRYVTLHEPGRDPVERLKTTIEWASGSSTQLLMGYRGTGKTTQVQRLAAQLQAMGYHAYRLDAEDYLNTAVPVDVIDYLLFLAGSLGDCLGGGGDGGFWERIWQLFRGWGVEGASLATPGGFASVDFKRNLKEDPSFLDRLRRGAAGRLGALLAEVRQYLLEVPGAADGRVVLLVDSTDHFQGSLASAEAVQASVQALFTDHHDKLRLPVHAVYTVPPYLKARAKNVSSYYGGALTTIPEVRVHKRGPARELEPDGVRTLVEVVSKRGDWRRLVREDDLERLVGLSGGHVRDLLRMLAELAKALRGRSLPAERDLVDAVVAQVTSEALPIADDDAVWLARIAADHSAGLRSNEDIPALARFLNQGLVLCYFNGEEWYDLHPLIRDVVLAQARVVDQVGEPPPAGEPSL